MGSGGKSNRLVNYSQTPRPAITPGGASVSSRGGASTNSTATSSQANSVNFFTAGIENGFSFDAFGLDASLVDQEVSAAMKELAGEWGDEFPVQSFDSPNASRSPSPPLFDEDGFEDGFRLTGISGLPLQVRESPAGSDRSSLSSRSTDKLADGRSISVYDEAGFPIRTQLKTPSKMQQQVDDDGWATFGSSAFGDSSFGDPFVPNYAQSEPGVVSRPRLPRIPQLEKPAPKDDGFDTANFANFLPNSTRGPQSNASAADSDIINSDVGVSSENGVNANAGVIPMEIVGSKEKKMSLHKAAAEEKKEYEQEFDNESYAEWSVRSPVKQIETWGDDITPDETDDMETHEIPPQERTQQARLQVSQSRNLNGSKGTAGLKTVEKKLTSEQQLRALECAQQRTSFESLKSRLKAPKAEPPKTYAKSDVGVLRSNAGSAEFSAVLNRVRNGVRFDVDVKPISSSRPQFNGVADLGSKSDGPRTNVSSHEHSYSHEGLHASNHGPQADSYTHEEYEGFYEDEDYLEGDYEEGDYQDGYYDDEYSDQQSYDYDDEVNETTPQASERHDLSYREPQEQQGQRNDHQEVKPKKLTYREQRELELRKVREEKERQAAAELAKAPPDRDVAALIRQRIAANKSMGAKGAEDNGKVENLGNVKNRLKRVSIESKITQFRAPAIESQPEFMVVNLKKVSGSTSFDTESVQSQPSPIKSVKETREMPSPESHDFINAAEEEFAESAIKREAPSPLSAIHDEIASRAIAMASESKSSPAVSEDLPPLDEKQESIAESTADTKAQLNAFFANRLAGRPVVDANADNDDIAAVSRSKQQKESTTQAGPIATSAVPEVPSTVTDALDGRPALKNDPKYDRYFRMLKVGMPMPVVKHAMERDGVDPSVMDGDHNKPAGYGAGVPLKQDPKFAKYFKMLNMGLPMGAVKNAMERDGLDASVMDRDHNLPANVSATGEAGGAGAVREENKVKDTHRRTRLHWDTARKVRSNSLWAKIDQDEELEGIQIDEDEFQKLFQAELTPVDTNKSRVVQTKKGAAVRVIDSKRANNGGIILARLKMTHDEMADAVDRIDHQALSTEQMQNIIEYLPTSDERKALEAYMLSGGIDAAEKFDGLCECEKFMVAMMTVKHAKRKVRALLFKLQFQSCLDSLDADTAIVESACDELINSVRLRKLLGIVLNVGNRLNTAGVSGKGKAGAFSLESLLKLNHAKAFDKKTTFLHYIILVVQRNNELLLRVKDDLPTVMKAGRVFWDQLEQDLEEVENQLENVRKIALHQARLMTRYRLRKKKKAHETEDDENSLSDSSLTLEEEVESLRASEIGLFTLGAIKKVSGLRDKVETTKQKFVKLREYFGEDDKQEMQPHDIFNIIATFCRDFEKAKEEVSNNMKKKLREERMTKRANSDPNLAKEGTPTQTNGKHPPPRMKSEPALRISNHQPNLHQVVKAPGARPVRNSQQSSQHQPVKSPQANGVQRDPRAVAQGQPTRGLTSQQKMVRPRPPARPLQNGSHGNATVARPPARPTAPKGNDSVRETSGPQMSPSSMRQKVMQRRRRTAVSNSTSDTSVTSTTATLSTNPSSAAHGVAPMNESAYAALGRRVANDSMNQLSPRSSIRQRRREDQRRQLQQTTVTKWPDSSDKVLEEVDFALD